MSTIGCDGLTERDTPVACPYSAWRDRSSARRRCRRAPTSSRTASPRGERKPRRPKRICWGTDSLWYGSPHKEIVAMRRFEFTEKGKELYGLPYGLEGWAEDPTKPAPDPSKTIRNALLGYNAAEAYNFDSKVRAQA